MPPMTQTWHPFGKPWRDFEAANLNQPGTVVVVSGEMFLIGHINELRGVCDDCTEFSSGSIVEQYLVMTLPERPA